MSKLKETVTTNGLLVQKAFVEELDKTPKIGKKPTAKYDIQNHVYEDLSDSVADNAKMISLIFAMGATIYEVLSATAKSKIPAQAKETIEYAIQKFHETQTWGDIQLAQEGHSAIDKLLKRQGDIGDIIKKVYDIK